MNPQEADRFRQMESQYFILRGQLETKRITREQFDSQVQALMLTDARGRYWTMSPDTARWHVYENNAWREADPFAAAPAASPPPPPPLPIGTPISAPAANAQPATPAYTPPPSPAYGAPAGTPVSPPAPPQVAVARQGSGWGCGRIFACGCAAAALLVVVCGISAYLGFTSGAITLPSILKLVGMGPTAIEVDNFRDDRIDVSVRSLDTASETPSIDRAIKLNAFDVKLINTSQSGRFRVSFAVSGSRINLGACTLTVRSGDLYQFVALPEKLVVNRVNNPVSIGRDLVVDTSALCR